MREHNTITLSNGKEMMFSTSQTREYDESLPTLYVLTYSAGHYDTYVNGALSAYETYEEALQRIIDHEEWREHVRQTAIHGYTEESMYEETFDDEHPDPYEKFREQFRNDVWNEMFGPNREFEDLSEDEEQKYWDIVDDSENKAFLDWLINKRGLTKDVAECTIIYNEADEWDDYRTNFGILKINVAKYPGSK